MDARIIAIAVPFFFLLIGIESVRVRKWKDSAYRLYDSLCNLSCGMGQQVLAIVLEVIVVGGYIWVHDRYALFHIPMTSILGWTFALLGVDFAYYWYHRISHRVNFVWAAHVVHHQSEEYNLSVALRQSWLQQITTVPFYFPLAILGVPPAMYITMHTVDTVYQFWIHTRAVGKLGPLEWILNTPSHHRVHHGINPKYIDKNYAGMLIIWDRIFGTFIEEQEEPTYGTVKPLASFNPTWANLEYWIEIAGLMRSCKKITDKIKAPFMPPEWRPEGDVVIPEASRATQTRYDARAPKPLKPYVIALFVQSVLSTVALLVFKEHLPKPLVWGLIVFTLWTLTTLSGFVERKFWAFPLESLRLGAALGSALFFVGPKGLPWAMAFAIGMAGWLRWLRFREVGSRS